MATLELSLIATFIIIGAHIVTNWEGMLLYWVHSVYEVVVYMFKKDDERFCVASNAPPIDTKASKFIEYIAKPIFTCPYCMSSLWTVATVYLHTGGLTWFIIPQMLLTCGIVAVLWGAINYFKEN